MKAECYSSQIYKGIRWMVHPDYLKSFPAGIPFEGVGKYGAARCTLVSEKSGRKIVEVEQGWIDRGNVVIKRYNPRVWMEYIKYIFIRTRAEAEWVNNILISEIDVPTPIPLAVGEKVTLGIWRGSDLVLESISPRMTLIDYLRETTHNDFESTLVKNVATYVARIHNGGFYYRDLHGGNILVSKNNGKPPSLYFLDLHEVRVVKKVSKHMCIDDLGRLNSSIYTSARNRIAFLKQYLAERKIPDDDWKEWARAIDTRSREIWDRNFKKRGTRVETY